MMGPNFFPGMVYMFKCCCEGKKISFKNNRFENEDGFDVNGTEEHPFLIISSTEQNIRESYLTVIPITSSGTAYNDVYSKKIASEMVRGKAQSLVQNNSYLKIGHPTRIFKNHISKDRTGVPIYIGEFYPTMIPFIVSEVVKSIGAKEILNQKA